VHPVDVEYARCEDADIAKIEVEQLARNAAEMEGPLTRAIRTLGPTATPAWGVALK
jgi:hypothetical protein